jgi:hypothetical protein
MIRLIGMALSFLHTHTYVCTCVCVKDACIMSTNSSFIFLSFSTLQKVHMDYYSIIGTKEHIYK